MSRDILNEPRHVDELVAYQPGAIVSRTLLSLPSGNVTLFAFDAGESLSEHTTPHDALVYLLDGRARIWIGETEHRVEAGQMLLLPANVPHALEAETPFKMLLVLFKT